MLMVTVLVLQLDSSPVQLVIPDPMLSIGGGLGDRHLGDHKQGHPPTPLVAWPSLSN